MRLAQIVFVLFIVSGCSSSPDRRSTSQAVVYPEMIELPSGEFLMGDQAGRGDPDERPIRLVRVEAFAISKHEITRQDYHQFLRATGNRPAANTELGNSSSAPITDITFEEAKAFTEWLSDTSGYRYSLPTEAQWEYAARAGRLTLFYHGNNQSSLCEYANIADLSLKKLHPSWQVTDCDDGFPYLAPVGRLRPNAFGLYDMLGNAWEWVDTCYQPQYPLTTTSSVGLPQSCNRVVRGGSFQLPAENARLSNRRPMPPSSRSKDIGFRVVKTNAP